MCSLREYPIKPVPEYIYWEHSGITKQSVRRISELQTKRSFKAMAEAKKAIDSVTENYFTGLELIISLWEENLKALSSLDKWVALQGDYISLMKTWNGELKSLNSQTNRYMSLQNDYLSLIRNVVNLSRKNTEAALSVFNNYLSLFGVVRG
jgi:hypothetical protein